MLQEKSIDPAGAGTADPGSAWIVWDLDTTGEIAEKVAQFEPLDHPAGHRADRWLKTEARVDVFTATYLLVSDERLEGFITCRVSEATLTWSGIERLGGTRRKTVPAYLLCWCAKHREAEVEGEELLLNALRLARELRPYGCAILALDPHDKASSEKVWEARYGFRRGAVLPDSEHQPRLWLPLDVD